jgi:hypothetical protein
MGERLSGFGNGHPARLPRLPPGTWCADTANPRPSQFWPPCFSISVRTRDSWPCRRLPRRGGTQNASSRAILSEIEVARATGRMHCSLGFKLLPPGAPLQAIPSQQLCLSFSGFTQFLVPLSLRHLETVSSPERDVFALWQFGWSLGPSHPPSSQRMPDEEPCGDPKAVQRARLVHVWPMLRDKAWFAVEVRTILWRIIISRSCCILVKSLPSPEERTSSPNRRWESSTRPSLFIL